MPRRARTHSRDRRDIGIFDALDFWDAHPEITHPGLNRTEEDRHRICRVTKTELVPTLTWSYWDGAASKISYRALLLEDYTEEMSARHTQGASPDALWSLFEESQR